MDYFTSVFIAGLGCALLGWILMLVSSRIGREHQRRHPDRFGEHEPPLNSAASVD